MANEFGEEEVPGTATTEQSGAGAPGAGAAEVAPEPEITMADVMTQLKSLQTHVGRIPAMQSRLDSIPKTFESTIDKRLKEAQTQSYLSTLTPEERQQYEQQRFLEDKAQREQKELVRNAMKEYLPSEYSGLLEFAQRAQDKEQAENFFTSIEEALGEEDSKRIVPIIGKYLQEHRQKINSGDPDLVKEATEWMEKAIQAPERVALRALRELQQQVSSGETRVIDERVNRGKALAAGPRGTLPAATPKNLRGMSQKDLEAQVADMPTAEYEKMLAASKR